MPCVDLHLVTGVGQCRDLLPGVSSVGCEADPLTVDYLDKILEIEKPDLAVVVGDIINGEDAPDAQTVLSPIPYCSPPPLTRLTRLSSKWPNSLSSAKSPTPVSLATTTTRATSPASK